MNAPSRRVEPHNAGGSLSPAHSKARRVACKCGQGRLAAPGGRGGGQKREQLAFEMER